MTPEEIADWEDEWAAKPGPPGRIGFIPYPLDGFRTLLKAALATRPATPSFLDLGAGIGSKLVVASQMGCKPVNGVEVVASYVAEARRRQLPVAFMDVTCAPVAFHAIVYLNHPLADPAAERALEERVHAELSPHALLIQVRGLTPIPHGAHWQTICQLNETDAVARKLGERP